VSTRGLEPTVSLSVLDRLVDHEPGLAADPPLSWSDSVARLRLSLLRDLDWLLNTRRIAEPAPADLSELRASVYHFGLADVTSLSGDSAETPELLRRRIEECLRLFEPRLTAIQVTPVTAGVDPHHRIRFSIEALLRMEPNPERVTFDTVLEVGSGEFSVRPDADA
jgi:type VI secretion system protein ImpF